MSKEVIENSLTDGDLANISGLYSGKVMQVANDPENGERIKVHIPLLHSEQQGVWARWVTPYAGGGYGVVFRPEPDDEVLLGFLGGDPHAPVILGSLHSRAAPAPSALKATDEKNKSKGLVSKNGLTLLLDEDDKSITIKTPAGQSLVINDKSGSVELKDKNNNCLTLDKNGVTIKSAKDITLNAAGDVKITARHNFSAEGLDASVLGKKAIRLGGQAMGELKTSGPLAIKGAIVQIN
ncbi:phage baseplate assembly protein V [Desulfovibrio sp. OttesenSCG-928-C06]|nr:phage baseplate assembly protein V [Desulfovibrio sp. OttesenSCG-928-C06]